jgi:hypothetical protein
VAAPVLNRPGLLCISLRRVRAKQSRKRFSNFRISEAPPDKGSIGIVFALPALGFDAVLDVIASSCVPKPSRGTLMSTWCG